MALETVAHISDLVATNPTSGDPVSQGDDHIRNIKTALLADLVNNATKSSSSIELTLPDGTEIKAGITTTATSENTNFTTNFVNGFTTNCVGVWVQDNAASTAGSVSWSVSSRSKTSFAAFWSRSGTTLNSTSRVGFFFAIGY